MSAVWIAMLGGGILLPLLWTLRTWRKRRHFASLLEQEHCRLCGTAFSDAIYEIEGPITPSDRQRLDQFQQTYAAYRVRCDECNAINLCADNGTPMVAWPLA